MLAAHENPFRTTRLERVRYRLPGTTWPELVDRFEAMDRRAALVGPHGSGKTTFLEHFAPHLEAAGHRVHRVHVGRGGARLRDVAPARDETLVIDGIEAFGFLDRLRFWRRFAHLPAILVTSHRRAAVPTLLRCRPSLSLFEELAAELAGDASILRGLDLRAIYRRHRGNIRGAFLELYDRVGEGSPGGRFLPAFPR